MSDWTLIVITSGTQVEAGKPEKYCPLPYFFLFTKCRIRINDEGTACLDAKYEGCPNFIFTSLF